MAWKFSENVLVTKVQDATVAGITDVTSDSVDMEGYDGVFFRFTVGAITGSAVTSVHAEQSADDSTFADLEDTNITIADDDDNQIFWVEIVDPGDRYVRIVVDRATQNAVVGEIYADQFGPRDRPCDNVVDDTITGESHVNPDEGTI